MDAHKIILTSLTKRQLSEIKKKYRKALQEIYGMNRSPYYEESFENYILHLAKLLFLGFTSVSMIGIIMLCGIFSKAGFIVTGAVFVISLCFVLISIIIKKIKIKLSFTTVISLLMIYWKAKIYKISMSELD